MAGFDVTHYDTEWSVWFEAEEKEPGVLVVMTMRANGEVAGFEVHSGDERQMPLERGDKRQVVRPRGDGEPVALTAPMMRRIPFGELANVARVMGRMYYLGKNPDRAPDAEQPLRKFLERPEDASDAVKQSVPHLVAETLRVAREQTPNPRRRGRPDRYYAQIAAAYESWVPTGLPLRVLADELGPMAVPTLRTALQEARRRMLLTDAPGKGRKGGHATDKAKRLLEEGDDDGEH